MCIEHDALTVKRQVQTITAIRREVIWRSLQMLEQTWTQINICKCLNLLTHHSIAYDGLKMALKMNRKMSSRCASRYASRYASRWAQDKPRKVPQDVPQVPPKMYLKIAL